MAKVIWQTNSTIFFDSFSNRRLVKGAKGGVAYNYQASTILSNRYDFSLDEKTIKRENENALFYCLRISRNQTHADVCIKDPYVIAFGGKNSRSREIGMIHHIDFCLGYKSFKWKYYLSRLKRRLKDLDIVVTVSEYWESELRKIGCRNVEVIYNSFDSSDFRFRSDEIERFLIEYAIPRNKPLIYIGNASVQKGVIEVFNSLNNEDYTLVMTGPTAQKIDIPVLHLDLNRRDYLRLLKVSDVCITMSKMVEGWNRTAHEAMLCGTPVIGSGTGGMRELLTKGKQTIVSDYKDMPNDVKRVLENKDKIGAEGFNYVKQYNLNYFSKKWISLIGEVSA